MTPEEREDLRGYCVGDFDANVIRRILDDAESADRCLAVAREALRTIAASKSYWSDLAQRALDGSSIEEI